MIHLAFVVSVLRPGLLDRLAFASHRDHRPDQHESPKPLSNLAVPVQARNPWKSCPLDTNRRPSRRQCFPHERQCKPNTNEFALFP